MCRLCLAVSAVKLFPPLCAAVDERVAFAVDGNVMVMGARLVFERESKSDMSNLVSISPGVIACVLFIDMCSMRQ